MTTTFTINQTTYLKASMKPANLLSVNQALKLEAGTVLSCSEWGRTDRYFWVKPYNLVGIDLSSVWYLFDAHCAKQDGGDAPTSAELAVPYASQLDNENAPYGTCNLTSVAMCLEYYGVKSSGEVQLEDQLFEYCEAHDMDRHVHDDLVKVFDAYGIDDTFTTEASWADVRNHLASGNPVILSAQFTRSGHIVVATGFDSDGLFINDPYGEYFEEGYNTDNSGEGLHYSYNLLKSVTLGDGGENTTWAHFPRKRPK